jgi:hypothetical protein
MRAGELGAVPHRADVTSKRNRWLPRKNGTSSSRSPRALALPVDPAWYPGVRSSLAITWMLAALVAEFELPDDAEPAPVFRA